MSVALNYQLSIFGNYSILPSPEVVTTLMLKINESTGEVFLPNIINSQQLEIPANRITTISNLGFVSQDQKYSISILNNRIDVNYNRTANSNVEINNFFDLASKALMAIMNNSELKSSRLALNLQMIYELPDFAQMTTLGKSIIRSANYYTEKPLCEWSTRVNSQTNIEILGAQEGINVIADMSTAQSVQGTNVAILYHIDINTLPQNIESRFAGDSICPFIENAMPIAEKIIGDIEGLITSA